MDSIKWKNPHRKRHNDIRYTNADYVIGYDLDLVDFEYIVNKLKNNQTLTEQENIRYGNHILTVIELVIEGPKYKNKSYEEKQELREQMYYELCTGITQFDPSKGKLYSYAYRIAWIAGIHYYKELKEFIKKNKAIEEHCQEEYNFYLDEYSDHKVRTMNKGE